MSRDIIGDIHGHADQLEALLSALGYRHVAGAYRHPTRTAIFVGDFVDRGPGQLRTLQTVRAMTDAGSARAVMGNHEFNAISWATLDPLDESARLRHRHGQAGAKNRRQHEAFLAEVVEDSGAHRSWVDWFRSLPLWIEDPDLRVVHACWSPRDVERIRPLLDDRNRLTPAALVAANRRGLSEYEAVETLLKGKEVDLPPGYSFHDKDGHERRAIRTRWWRQDLRTYREAYIGPSGVNIPDLALPDGEAVPEPDRPTFIGHYWLDPREPPAPLSARVACVDFSVARGGPLVAYRFDGELELAPANFVAV